MFSQAHLGCPSLNRAVGFRDSVEEEGAMYVKKISPHLGHVRQLLQTALEQHARSCASEEHEVERAFNLLTPLDFPQPAYPSHRPRPRLRGCRARLAVQRQRVAAFPLRDWAGWVVCIAAFTPWGAAEPGVELAPGTSPGHLSLGLADTANAAFPARILRLSR